MQQQNDQRRSVREREERFKITRSIPKITASSAHTVLEELEAFEEEVIKTEPSSAKQWYQALEDALDGPALAWRNFVTLTDPGRSLLAIVNTSTAANSDFAKYYRFIRGALFERVGLRYKYPGERIKKMWEELRFHDMKYQEDVDEISDKLTKVYRQLIRHGLIVAGNACDERSLVVDLNEKIPEGTEMRR